MVNLTHLLLSCVYCKSLVRIHLCEGSDALWRQNDVLMSVLSSPVITTLEQNWIFSMLALL